MEHRERLVNIEMRAKSVNLTMSAVVRVAGIPAATVSRWRLHEIDPQMGNFSRATQRMEAVLEAEEHRLLRHLLALHPEFPATLTTQEAA